MIKKVLTLALCVCLVLCISVTAFAQEEKNLPISTAEEFLAFSQNCRLDSYSQGLQVTLTADIDLSDVEFEGIPVFLGSFDGGGHTISGLDITCAGSEIGLFRYVRETATVSNLTVKGNIQPRGSRSHVGGIAGSNAGKIINCTFDGTVSGSNAVGGVAGLNFVSGVIESCGVAGEISGSHFAGGVAGENQGVIRDCVNHSAVNTTPQQNSVELSDITIETITGSESAVTVTDIGGIAGGNSGVIRGCENRGNIGYKHMGYNVGGIAGSQTGYLTACENYGSVSGRKEVGGIVGQVEPVTLIEYTADTLQILQGQLAELDTLTTQASGNAQSSVSSISGQLEAVKKESQAARDAVDAMLPDVSFPESQLPEVDVPDKDAVLAAQSSLSSALSGIQGGMQGLQIATESAVDTVTGDLQAITDQINAIKETMNVASENLGGSITDVSDSDTAEELTGKTELCVNYGQVLGDRNIGGIAGAISLENDLDPEDDLTFAGNSSLNFEGRLRAVILSCENKAAVTATKQNVGGILGWQWMGLVKDCRNTGGVSCPEGDYVGGVVGRSAGFIRSCNAKCEITGSSYVGGIAGMGETVTDCRSMVQLSATERFGGILGFAENRDAILQNLCLPVGADIGGIDGISYDGCARSVSMEAFLKLEALPEMFRTVTAFFCFEDGTVQTVLVAPGEALSREDIPQLPEESDRIAYWEGLNEEGLSFDKVYTVAYTSFSTAIESTQTRENGLPVLLLEGSFLPEEMLSLSVLEDAPDLSKDAAAVEAWSFASAQQAGTARYLPPAGHDPERMSVFVLTGDGQWEQTTFTVDGSYLVFSLEAQTTGFCLVENAPDYTWLYIAVAVAAVVAISGTVVIVLRKKRKAAGAAQTQ